jgi:hypothetical protein
MDAHAISVGLALCAAQDPLTAPTIPASLDVADFQPPPVRASSIGFGHRSHAQAAHMRLAKNKKKAIDESTKHIADIARIGVAWNQRVLRTGDMIADGPGDDGDADRGYSSISVARLAWRSLGKDLLERDGVDGCHKGLAIVATSAGVHDFAQNAVVDQELLDMPAGTMPIIRKAYDATPSRIGFGKLQSEIMPHARYAVRAADGRWTSIPYDKYIEQHGRRGLLRYGIIDILAIHVRMAYMHPEQRTFKGVKVFCKPVALARGNASCIYRATEDCAKQFNRDGIIKIMSDSVFGIVVEVPDGASSNDRKKEKTKTDLPANCGFIGSKCGGHQGFRIIESRWKEVVGDVYAIAVTSSAVAHQNRLQSALWEIINEDLNSCFNIGFPDPEWLLHNKTILKVTVLREDLFTNGGINHDCSTKPNMRLGDFPAASKFYNALNGDWRLPRTSFWTAGRDITREDAKVLVYGACLEVDILQGNDSGLPSLDDWHSCAKYAARTTLGVLVHNLLQRAVDKALPTWGRMLPPNDDALRGGASRAGCEVARARIQRKAWRTKSVLQDKEKTEKIVLLTIFGLALEHMMLRLDYLDERGKGLFDLAFPKLLCPFVACRRFLQRVVTEGSAKESLLWPVFRHFSDGTAIQDNRIMDLARRMGQDMGSQVWWRFLNYGEPPFTLTLAVNPGLPEEFRKSSLRQIFAKPACCRDEACSQKVYDVFEGDWERAYNSQAFLDGLTTLAYIFNFTDMAMERLLAMFRKALDGNMKASQLEAICSKGFLMQLLSEHLKLGNENPRTLSRSQLLADGMPLRCGQRIKKRKRLEETPHQCGTFVQFRNLEDKKRKEANIQMDRTAYVHFVQDLQMRWAAMTGEEAQIHLQGARCSVASKRVRDRSECDTIERDVGIFANVVQVLGDKRLPMQPEFFDMCIKKAMNMPDDGPTPCFSKYEQFFREQQAPQLFVQDQGDIDSGDEFAYTIPCGLAHPELCAETHQLFIEHIRLATKELRTFLSKAASGSAHCLWWARRVVSPEGEEGLEEDAKRHFMLCHFRGSGPRVALLAAASLSIDHVLECTTDDIDDYMWKMDITLCGRSFIDADATEIELYYSALRFDNAVFFPEGNRRQIDVSHYCQAEVLRVYPKVKVAAPRASAEKKMIDKGVRNLPADTVKQKMPRPPGLIVVGPRPIDGSMPGPIARPIARVPRSDNGEDSQHDSGTDIGGSECGTEGSVTPPASMPSEKESDDEDYRAAIAEERRSRGKRPAPFKLYAGGQVLINRSAKTIDAKCYSCSTSIDRKYTPRLAARQPHTIAQGRMMGSHLLWLSLPCTGDAAQHLGQYTAAALPRAQRKIKRATAPDELKDWFDMERDPRSDESGGEPEGVPENRRQ